jgi:hypothetical protein
MSSKVSKLGVLKCVKNNVKKSVICNVKKSIKRIIENEQNFMHNKSEKTESYSIPISWNL